MQLSICYHVVHNDAHTSIMHLLVKLFESESYPVPPNLNLKTESLSHEVSSRSPVRSQRTRAVVQPVGWVHPGQSALSTPEQPDTSRIRTHRCRPPHGTSAFLACCPAVARIHQCKGKMLPDVGRPPSLVVVAEWHSQHANKSTQHRSRIHQSSLSFIRYRRAKCLADHRYI